MLNKLKQFKLIGAATSTEGGHTKYKYPGVRDAIDGNTAVIMVEREASQGAGAYPITPSTQMGEYWAEEVAKGHLNTAGHPLIFVEPESEHAAAGVTAGLSMTGLRAVNFTSSQGLAFMHESLYAAVGKRLTYVLNLGCRAITKASLNVHCAHDDYHCADDTGFIQVMAKNAQEAADLNMIARKTAELALTPAIVAQDGFLTTHLIEPMLVPERELIAEYLGNADDIIDTPTPAQQMLYGPKRRRVPANWDVDNPMQTGVVQNQDAYMQAVAAQRPYFFDHIPALFDKNAEEFQSLTGRRYSRVDAYRCDDADYVILGQGSMTVQAAAVADWMRENRKIKVGVVNITMFRPFPGELLGQVLKGKKGVAVLERTDQPLSEDLPLMREVRSTVTKCMENARENSYADYATYESAKDMPSLYSGCYGLGSRDLQPEGLIAAVENMLPGAAHRKFYYLSVDFVRAESANPKQEIRQQELQAAYPHIKDLALRGSENPNLLPKNAIAVRMHSIGGWGAVTTGKNLAMTLFELLGWDIKANPKYGSEKKGQPTTYYLSAAPEPIRINCEYTNVDVVLSPDPQVFGHTNALEGMRAGGVFIIQSNLGSAEALWETLPMQTQKYIVDKKIRVFYLDAFKIAREESSNPDLQLRMQGNAFQGAFFRASDVKERAGLSEETLFTAIENQLEHKFGKKGKRIVDDNLRVVRRGYEEIFEIKPEQMKVGQRAKATGKPAPALPVMLKRLPEGDGGISDVHRFWEQTGSFYMKGQGSDNLVDPFMGLSVIPAVTGVYRDMTGVRFEHPQWHAENCTACGECFTQCPDSAIPGLVTTTADVLNTAIQKIEIGGHPTRFLRKFSRVVDKKLRKMLDKDGLDVSALLANAITEAFAEDGTQGDDRGRLEAELNLLREQIGGFKFATTKPYWTQKEKKEKGAGGLFSITVNPYTCKGCALCVEVCGDNALTMVTQTKESIETLRDDWNFWLDLPTTPPQFSRIDDLDEKVGALETLLLDKHNYQSMVSGDGACLGCGEKGTIHLFTSTVTALQQPRVKKFLGKLDALIDGLENHIRMKLSATVDLTDTKGLMQAVQANAGHDLTLANLTESLLAKHPGQPIDPQWLKRVSQMLEKLKDLRWRYMEGPSKKGRAEMGMVNSTGCTSVWSSTFPFNPYPFPWTSHLFQDSPSVAMGVFEGHMAKMVEGFKDVRMAEMELAGGYDPDANDEFFSRFNWEQLSEEEWHLCPPVVALGGDGAMFDIGFQNLSRALMAGKPIKILIVDTQVYSNTGGQACTSGFIGQVADMSPYGASKHGKTEKRKEISVIGMAHRTSFVAQGSLANTTHLLESFIDGLNSRRPALFNVYAVCPPEHGVGDNSAVAQSKMAVESRAFPLFRYNPDLGVTFSDCVTLEGNPSLDADWPTYTLEYADEKGDRKSMTLPMTFADFALSEGRFAKQFKKAPPETWNEDMVLLGDFLKLPEGEREGKFPFIWSVDKKNRLVRVLTSVEMVRSCEERLQFWHQLKDVAGISRPQVDEVAIANRVRQELIQKLSAGLGISSSDAPQPAAPAAAAPVPAAAAADGYEPAWVDTPECTACDECIHINPKIFSYNEAKKIVIIDPKAGSYLDLVKAAEKCTASVIHPGTPWNMSEPNLDKLKLRAAKFN
ncbi:2-oxoacid:acceptor oxidoreductase family protein [Sideroxydans lithotrophicus]|uniref:Pyruvate flavodoxin/ferredoxin oxidoreductase domain protein n=1 Tax=Sideroxydans lithotrophicus (strain ES-1) TaxID=580332 RepID=D5CMN9_SIDLE|nr:2-oxoacid:acceptor oxidoreductase family protein [Sideroxydans lithotrophicus]ADE12711.1 pyruvate flavodoxin/ferredoxin oxidoreductase domain protein [Sideroxydans lithotrophicus ES-1]